MIKSTSIRNLFYRHFANHVIMMVCNIKNGSIFIYRQADWPVELGLRLIPIYQSRFTSTRNIDH